MKKGWIAGLVILACAAGGATWYYFEHGGFFQTSEDETVYVTQVSNLTGANLSGANSRYAGVVEAQNTVKVNADSGRVVKEVYVTEGEEVKTGQLLFEYDLSSIEDQLKQSQLDLDRLKNEALSYEEQIKTLEKEKSKAKSSEQLSYTIEIETNKMNLKKNEYDQIAKQNEIDRLQTATGNTEVRSTLDGVIQKIDNSRITTDASGLISDTLTYDSSSMYGDDSTGDQAFITILGTGAYRVKGQVSELNYWNLVIGSAMVVRSRMDETLTWSGTLTSVDTENSVNANNNYYYGMSTTSEQTTASTYPFYVTLDNSDGLMLGQHVYIELDEGQTEEDDGLWLYEYFIVDTDQPEPYVWVRNDDGKLEKRSVVLGSFDEYQMKYQIVTGLAQEDAIAFPVDSLKEGMKAVLGSSEEAMAAMYEGSDAEEYWEEQDFSEDDYGITEGNAGLYDESELSAYTQEASEEAPYGEETNPLDDYEEPVPIESAPARVQIMPGGVG